MTDLETERLQMREFRDSDAAAVARWEPSFRAEAFLEFCLHSYREWSMGPWAICSKRVDLSSATAASVVSVTIAPATNSNTAGRSTTTSLHSTEAQAWPPSPPVGPEVGFEEIRLTRIQGRCAPENVASERVMRNAGLKFDRMIAAAQSGSPDEKLYAISREDFQCSKSSNP